MGEGNATKGDLNEFARRMAAVFAEHDQRIHSLALAFDCLVTVIGKEAEVKAELEQRKKLIDERRAQQENKPLVSVP